MSLQDFIDAASRHNFSAKDGPHREGALATLRLQENEARAELFALKQQKFFLETNANLKKLLSPDFAELSALRDAFGLEITKVEDGLSFRMFFEGCKFSVLDLVLDFQNDGIKFIRSQPSMQGLQSILFDIKPGETLQFLITVRNIFKKQFSL